MPPNHGSRPTLTEAQLRALVETSAFCARTSSPAARRRALMRLLRSLVEAELVAVWLGRSGRSTGACPVPGAVRGLVLRGGARASPRGMPLVVRTRDGDAAAVVAVWRASEVSPAEAHTLVRGLSGWVARTLTDDPPQPGRGPTLVDANLLAGEEPAFLVYLATLLAAPPPRARGRGPRLTGREEEVAREVAAGYTNAEIADRLDMSEHTVKQHLKQVFLKLGVTRRAGLAGHLERAALAAGAPGPDGDGR